MKDAYFSSLIGRSVQVYRGGPNSNVGILLDVNGDYLALQKENGEIIYYKTSHIKSIKENSQSRFSVKVYNNSHKEESSGTVPKTVLNPNTMLVQAHSFSDLALNFKEQVVRVNGKGPESKVGKLIDVKGDYLIIHDEKDGLTFYQELHITSISLAVEEIEETDEENESGNEDAGSSSISEEQLLEEMNNLMEVYNQICAEDICGVLANLKYCWIKINRKGPESVEGLLVDANEDHLVLVVKDEIFRIATYHVKNFSVGLNYTEESDDENSENQDSNNENESNQNSSNSNSNNRQAYEEHLNQMMRIKRRKNRQKAQQSQGE